MARPMGVMKQPPVFVPEAYRAEIRQLSKAALMDMAWDYAMQIAGSTNPVDILREFRARREIIETHRKQSKGAQS